MLTPTHQTTHRRVEPITSAPDTSRCERAVQAHAVISRLATSPDHLEYSGISLNMKNSGNSQGILCDLGEKL